MSKSEKFIQDCTRNCSNEMESPLYANPKLNFYSWLTPDQARRAVEIEKEEMIEKVCEYLEPKIWSMNMGDQEFTDEFINDLKQAIKNE